MILLWMRQLVAPWVALQVRQLAMRSAVVTAPLLVALSAVRLVPQPLLTDTPITIRHQELITGTPHPGEAILTDTPHAGEVIRTATIALPANGKKDAVDRDCFPHPLLPDLPAAGGHDFGLMSTFAFWTVSQAGHHTRPIDAGSRHPRC